MPNGGAQYSDLAGNCAEYWEPGQDDTTLTGALLDGTRIEGADTICVVP